MKITLNLLAMICLSILSACSNGTNRFDDSNFTQIFNGENFDGWYLKIRSGDDSIAQKLYSIEDNGVIHVFNDEFPDKYELRSKNATHGLFYTNRNYSRYILRFDYKWGSKIANNYHQFQYDAGCYYHVIDDKIWPTGVEYQIRYNDQTGENHTGDYWIGDKSPIEWYSDGNGHFLNPDKGGEPTEWRIGEHRAAKDAKFNALNNEWNSCEIIVMGSEYSIHKLNNQIVNMATSLGIESGKIGLQSETAEIFYRNIRILEFTESIPMEEFLH